MIFQLKGDEITKIILNPGENENENDSKTILHPPYPQGAIMTVSYSSFFSLEEPSFENIKNFSFILGKTQTIPAFELAVSSMAINEHSRIFCTAPAAYGRFGFPPLVPPHKDLIWEITLLGVDIMMEECEKEIIPTKETILEKCIMEKEIGNEFFKAGNFQDALLQYTNAYRGLMLLKNHFDEAEIDEEFATAIFLNIAACNIKALNYTATLHFCEQVLEKNITNSKAHFRMGQAFLGLKEYSQAKKRFLEAAKLEPANKLIRKELENVKKLLSETH